ncbi:hypothetical protein [Bifidobacterium olomucense]|uniref:Uncharacterized protein n=1 Tax=Bifidobacterium olomucense TaxID=2675324 RepID=A0A7Y0EXD4_9BIFI|nr:hypothetical protein [Bifidobacterium sp. DSM 109959]NMM98137.1 hypothetical protein [Bifidobacterium sp. DSM 109959]
MRIYPSVDSAFIEAEILDYLEVCKVSPEDFDIAGIVTECIEYLSRPDVTGPKPGYGSINAIDGGVFADILKRHDVSETVA